jgi:hypothetical protein
MAADDSRPELKRFTKAFNSFQGFNQGGDMAAQFDYDDIAARSAARQFDQAGDDLAALVQGLSAELANDAPWSHDKIGSSFANQFDPNRAKAIGNAGDFAKGVQSVSPAITQAANSIIDHDGGGAG